MIYVYPIDTTTPSDFHEDGIICMPNTHCHLRKMDIDMHCQEPVLACIVRVTLK
jgi:hypothetical protein